MNWNLSNVSEKLFDDQVSRFLWIVRRRPRLDRREDIVAEFPVIQFCNDVAHHSSGSTSSFTMILHFLSSFPALLDKGERKDGSLERDRQ